METIGRDPERGGIECWLGSPDALLLVEGEVGIGKSTLWRAAVADAERRGYRVLACTAAGSETQLAFTTIRDLLADAFDEAADELPRHNATRSHSSSCARSRGQCPRTRVRSRSRCSRR